MKILHAIVSVISISTLVFGMDQHNNNAHEKSTDVQNQQPATVHEKSQQQTTRESMTADKKKYRESVAKAAQEHRVIPTKKDEDVIIYVTSCLFGMESELNQQADHIERLPAVQQRVESFRRDNNLPAPEVDPKLRQYAASMQREQTEPSAIVIHDQIKQLCIKFEMLGNKFKMFEELKTGSISEDDEDYSS